MKSSTKRALRSWMLWLYALALGAACFAGGRLSVAQAEPIGASCDAPNDRDAAPRRADRPQPEASLLELLSLPIELAPPPAEKAAAVLREREAGQSRALVGSLRARIHRAALAAAGPLDQADIVEQLNHYLEGWVDGSIHTSPALADDLAREIESALRDPPTLAIEVTLYETALRLLQAPAAAPASGNRS